MGRRDGERGMVRKGWGERDGEREGMSCFYFNALIHVHITVLSSKCSHSLKFDLIFITTAFKQIKFHAV